MYKAEGHEGLDDFSQVSDAYPLFWNPFISHQKLSQYKAEPKKAKLVKRLNLMYFPDDKIFYAKKLLPLVQSQINARPYHKEQWLELLNLQGLARSNGVDRMWGAETALILGGWENRYQAMVGLICLEEPPQLVLDDQAFCERRLEPFSSANTRRSLSLLGVDVRAVNEKLDLLKTFFCLFCE